MRALLGLCYEAYPLLVLDYDDVSDELEGSLNEESLIAAILYDGCRVLFSRGEFEGLREVSDNEAGQWASFHDQFKQSAQNAANTLMPPTTITYSDHT
jgi:hypothetical protein